jgi:dsRNA-specific ribonuclease
VLSDIVESTLGAMFLDSGFDMNVIDTFFKRHFAEYFETDDPPTIQRHPMVTIAHCIAESSLYCVSIFKRADAMTGKSS